MIPQIIRSLEKSQLDYLIDSLRRETGLIDLHFNQEGYLGIHNRDRVRGGSATARGLLLAAIDGHLAIELETHNSSPRVVFADVIHKITIRYTENASLISIGSVVSWDSRNGSNTVMTS